VAVTSLPYISTPATLNTAVIALNKEAVLQPRKPMAEVTLPYIDTPLTRVYHHSETKL